MKTMMLAALSFAALAASSVRADTVVFNGDTTGGPTYNRVVAGGPPTDLSLVGTDVAYQVVSFTVGLDGNYDLNALAGYDNFLTLYAGSFDPSDALLNAIIASDDRPTIGISGFAVDLLSGVSYFAVASGFNNDDFGAYELTISGPGDVLIGGGGGVPEPASWALMIAGFGMVGASVRRRRAAVAA